MPTAPRPALIQKCAITLRALTQTTECAVRKRGAAPFLPALTADRFSKLGGIDRDLLVAQLRDCRSLEDAAWANYWSGFADEALVAADHALGSLGGPTPGEILDGDRDLVVEQLRAVVAPASELLYDRRAETGRRFREQNPEHAIAADAIDALVHAMTYLFAACWPGWTPRRLAAYARSRRIFDVLVHALAPAMGVVVETFSIDLPDDQITGYAVLPASGEPAPAILLTNGLEGTIAEVALPALLNRPANYACFLMEMPGTFSYRQPLSASSERYYRAVIDHIAAHPRVDSSRIGMQGVSFGAHWSTRMAARDPRLRAVVSNGGLYDRAFRPGLGMAEIMTSTLERTTGARGPLDLLRKLRALAIPTLLSEITIPILAVNGDSDTLIPTRDTVELARRAPRGELRLYPGDDHCAMGHYDEVNADAIAWLREQLER